MKYAYEIVTRRVKDPDFPYHGQTLNSPAAAVGFVQSLTDLDREQVLILFLNAKNRLIGITKYSGVIDQVYIAPRDIVKTALLTGATGVVMCHNHPSGDPAPSLEDKAVTDRTLECLKLFDIHLLDHCIVTDSGYFSMKEHCFF